MPSVTSRSRSRADQHAVDHPLQVERRQQHEDLERQRQHEDLRQRAPQAARRGRAAGAADASALDARLEVGRRACSSSATPVKWRRHLVQRQPAHAARRVVDRRATSRRRLHAARRSGSGPSAGCTAARAAAAAPSRRAAPAACSCSWSAMRTRSAIVAPFSDTEKRWRKRGQIGVDAVGAATIARQARPHSAASVCRIIGRRGARRSQRIGRSRCRSDAGPRGRAPARRSTRSGAGGRAGRRRRSCMPGARVCCAP